jgi:hypothetical protein
MKTGVCEQCGSVFDRPIRERRQKRFCSMRCKAKAWRGRHPDRSRRSNRVNHVKQHARRSAWRAELKNKPCADCGKRFLPVCMEFDHRVGSIKLDKVSNLFSIAAPRERIQKEASKCDLVCANCHRLRTYKRRPASVTTGYWARFYEEARRIREELKTKPCVNCGGVFLSCCLDFHHRAGEAKSHNVARLFGRGQIALALAEIKKCDLVCANCHRILARAPVV